MTVLIHGKGIVGRATEAILNVGTSHVVHFHDPPKGLNRTALYCDVLIICTPCIDGEIDDVESIVKRTVGKRIIVRSTVKPSALADLQSQVKVPVDHWPEFLSAKTAMYDALQPDKVVYGTNSPGGISEFLHYFWGDYFMQFSEKLLITTPAISAASKLAINTFYTVQNIFWNALYDADPENYEVLRRILARDKRINPTHDDILADGYRGVGGFCLPKDTRNFSAILPDRWKPLFAELMEINRQLNVEKP